MVRRIVVIVFSTLALAAAGLGIYSLVRDADRPPVVDEPVAPDRPAGPDDFVRLAETDPVGMFEVCLATYREQANGFTAVIEKQECVAGESHDREVIKVVVWGEVGPHPAVRVRMVWEAGFRKDPLGYEVHGSLFPAGGRPDQVTVYRPHAPLIKEWTIGAKDSRARGASRFCIRDSGIYRGMLRTHAAWKKKREAGELQTVYEGVRRVKEAGDRDCHVVRRICPRPEADSFSLDEAVPADPKEIARDGFVEVVVMVDAATRLHVGTILKRPDGTTLAEYYFRDVQLLSTEPPPETFSVAGLKAALRK